MERKTNSLPFEKKSNFNNDRDSFVDKNGNYVYTRWVQRSNGKYEREVVDIVPLTAENRDIILLLDQDDHDCDLQERYNEENADYSIRNLQNNFHGNLEDEDTFISDPLEAIPDPSADTFLQILPDEEPSSDPQLVEIEKFISTELNEEQQRLLFAHLGEGKFLEDIRREEEAATGKKVSKQAVQQRWDRIISKACRHFGVEKPKQEHKRNSNQKAVEKARG